MSGVEASSQSTLNCADKLELDHRERTVSVGIYLHTVLLIKLHTCPLRRADSALSATRRKLGGRAPAEIAFTLDACTFGGSCAFFEFCLPLSAYSDTLCPFESS